MVSDLASLWVKDAGVFLAIFWAVFLFWRACRHEFFGNDQIFDTLLVAVLGGLFFGRITGFLINFEEHGLSAYRFLFFHVYRAFNFWGFILGCLLATAVFFRNKKISVFSFFDLAAGPIIFGLFVYFLFLTGAVYLSTGKVDLPTLVFTVSYLLLFFVIERLTTLKRHTGFFTCYFLVFTPVTALLHFLVFELNELYKVAKIYENVLTMTVVIFGGILWYRLSERHIRKDVNQAAGYIFLRLAGFMRTITSVNEAGNVSKALIIAPYTILHGILVLLRSLVKETKAGLEQFYYALGVKKLR